MCCTCYLCIFIKLWIVIYRDDDDDDDDVWSSRLYDNLMRRSIFMTIHMNVLCDDGHIMTHVLRMIMQEVCYFCDLYTTIIIITVCDCVWVWITIMRM